MKHKIDRMFLFLSVDVFIGLVWNKGAKTISRFKSYLNFRFENYSTWDVKNFLEKGHAQERRMWISDKDIFPALRSLLSFSLCVQVVFHYLHPKKKTCEKSIEKIF